MSALEPKIPLDPWYVTGFADGESAFTYSHSNGRLSLYFAIKLTAADRRLLEQLRSYFGGIGRIYEVKSRPAVTPNSGHTKAAVYFRVCRREELAVVIKHFDRYPLQGIKAESFLVWRQMAQLSYSPQKGDRQMAEELAQKLSALSPRNQLRQPPVVVSDKLEGNAVAVRA